MTPAERKAFIDEASAQVKEHYAKCKLNPNQRGSLDGWLASSSGFGSYRPFWFAEPRVDRLALDACDSAAAVVKLLRRVIDDHVSELPPGVRGLVDDMDGVVVCRSFDGCYRVRLYAEVPKAKR